VTVKAALSDDLPEDSFLAQIGGAMFAEIQTGVISEDLEFDSDHHGEAMVTMEDDSEGGIDLGVVFNPTVTIHEGSLSGAQALALSSLQSIQRRLGLEMTDLQTVTN
jgi:hypothetical protein